MLINYIEIRNIYEKRINTSSEKVKINLTHKIQKLCEWADESVRKYKLNLS